MTEVEYFDEQIRNSKTDNPNANEILSMCGIDQYCVVERLEKLKNIGDESIILETVNDIMQTYQRIGFYCHHQGHHIGMFLYGYFEDLPKTLANANRNCGGSMYHGILQNYFMSEILLQKNNIEDIEIVNTCVLENFSSIQELLECDHGLGHGLAEVYKYDLFLAVKRCDELRTHIEQKNCQMGIFMENIDEFYENKGGLFDKNDILFPCNKMDKKYAGTCYHYHTSYMITKNNSLEDVIQLCDKGRSSDIIEDCYSGVGRINSATSTKWGKKIELCKVGDSRYQDFCILGVMATISDHFGSEKGLEFCKFVPSEFKDICYDGLGKWVLMEKSTEDETINVCLKAESQKYKSICQNANLEGRVLL